MTLRPHPEKVRMFDDLLDNLQKRKSIQERLAALNETKSWEQIALALYNIDETNGAFRGPFRQLQAERNRRMVEAAKPVNEDLADYARRELEIAGLFDEDSDYEGMIGEAVMQLVEMFASQGHSGCSADITRSIFDRLASFKPLTELTNDPAEWNEIAHEMVSEADLPLYQSARSPTCFSRDGGKTYWNIDEIEGCRVPGKEPMHTSVNRKDGNK